MRCPCPIFYRSLQLGRFCSFHGSAVAPLVSFFAHFCFQSGTHSGVIQKGTDRLFALWLGFFREDLVSLAAILVLVPMSLYLNWQLGLSLIALSLTFVVLTFWVLRRTTTLQRSMERLFRKEEPPQRLHLCSGLRGNVAVLTFLAQIGPLARPRKTNPRRCQ